MLVTDSHSKGFKIEDIFLKNLVKSKKVKMLKLFIHIDLLSFRMEIPFVFTLLQSGVVHGLAFWFDVAYSGSKYKANSISLHVLFFKSLI